MDFLYLLNQHLDFIERFYNAAAAPFETTMRKIEDQENPFVPSWPPGDYDGPEYLEEFMEADECLCVVGSSSLGLLKKALHDYLREFVKREEGPSLGKYKGSWFDKHCGFLEEHTPFRWSNAPVTREQIEQINLSRNDFEHDSMLSSVWPSQSREHFQK